MSGEVNGSRYVLDPDATGARVRRDDGPAARHRRPAPARRASQLGRRGLRRPAGRRVGDRPRRQAVAAPVATRHHRGPRRAPRAGLRPGPGRRDVPRAAHGARARPLGPAAARGGPRGRGARRHRDAARGRRERGRDRGRRPRRASTSGSPARSPRADARARSSTRFRRPAALRARGGSAGSAPRCPAWPSTCSTGSTPISKRSRALAELTSRQLIALLHRSRAILRALHAHEILMGMLTDTGRNRMTGASVALRVLVEARQDGLSDAEILARSPVVLALTPPRVAPRARAAGRSASRCTSASDEDNANDNGILREALRLRVRWVQELSGRAAWELGERLAALGDLARRRADPPHDPRARRGGRHQAGRRRSRARHDPRARLRRAAPGAVPALRPRQGHPRAVRVDEVGRRHRRRRRRRDAGRSPTTPRTRPPGSVLVTTTLTPGLGPLLTRLDGIVAETGSVLSHLAILAREAGVATVVGYAGAIDDLPEGAMVVVDGDTGQVTIDDEETAMKIIAWLAGIATLVAAAAYMIVSLNRWEWNRALFFGLIVLIAEVGLATGLVLRRSTQLDAAAARPRRRSPSSATPGRRHPIGSPGSRSRRGQHQRLHHVPRRRRCDHLGDRVARRPGRLEHVDARRRGATRRARSRRSATRAAGCSSTTSPCSPRTCPAPTTRRSASCSPPAH